MRCGSTRVWVEGDSTSILAFGNSALVPFRVRNRWHNCFHGGIHILSSHVLREGNACTLISLIIMVTCLLMSFGGILYPYLLGRIFSGTYMVFLIIISLRYLVLPLVQFFPVFNKKNWAWYMMRVVMECQLSCDV